MPRRARPALPTRDGLGPTKIVLGKSQLGMSLAEALSNHSGIALAEIKDQFAQNNIVDLDGVPLRAESVLHNIMPIYVYREPLAEVPVPYDINIISHTEHFIVIDKPHFLASIPRGMHITETAVIRLRRKLGIDTLCPAHRLDRLTAGLLLFTTKREYRGAYQQLFARGKVRKTYHALAEKPSEKHVFPLQVTSRIEKTPGIMRAYEVAGPANAHSIINYAHQHPSGLGEYILHPLTGKTHQLRMHMWKINRPIWGDPLYPVDLMSNSEDFSTPLHLRAQTLEFIDPFTRNNITVQSQLPWLLT